MGTTYAFAKDLDGNPADKADIEAGNYKIVDDKGTLLYKIVTKTANGKKQTTETHMKNIEGHQYWALQESLRNPSSTYYRKQSGSWGRSFREGPDGYFSKETFTAMEVVKGQTYTHWSIWWENEI